MTVCGVDGCPAGWIAAIQDEPRGPIHFRLFGSAAELVDSANYSVITIDVPIGLRDKGVRLCDVEARGLLGLRGSSVFPAPIRPVLGASDHATASEMRRKIEGKGMSIQTFGIIKKIAEVDVLLCERPELCEIVREVHPELCFCVWNHSVPMSAPKKTVDGKAERLDLIQSRYGNTFDAWRPQLRRKDVADDDMIDAMAALWTAERIVAGAAIRVPQNPVRDGCNLPMEMWA